MKKENKGMGGILENLQMDINDAINGENLVSENLSSVEQIEARRKKNSGTKVSFKEQREEETRAFPVKVPISVYRKMIELKYQNRGETLNSIAVKGIINYLKSRGF